MNTVDTVKIMAMGAIIALLGMIALNGGSRTTAADAAATGKLIALTDSVKNQINLFLIDTELKCIAVYTADDTGFGLSTSRNYGFDFVAQEIEKYSRRGYTYKEAKKIYEEQMKLKP